MAQPSRLTFGFALHLVLNLRYGPLFRMTGCGAEVRVKNGLKLISSYKWLGDEVRRKLEMEKKLRQTVEVMRIHETIRDAILTCAEKLK